MNVLTENKFINKGKEFSKKLRKVILNEELKLTNKKIPREELNFKNFNINIRKIIPPPINDDDIINSERNYTNNPLPLIKNNKMFYDSLKAENKNFESEGNDYDKIIKVKKTKNIDSNSFRKDNLNILLKKHKKYDNFAEVDKIVNLLINSPKNYLSENIKSNVSEEKEKIKFPKEKMIDPIYYIKYNINFNSTNKNKPKGFKQYIKEIEKSAKSHKNKPRLLNETRDINYGKIQIENSNTNIEKYNYKDLFEKSEKPKNFIFGIKDANCYKKIRNQNYIRINPRKQRLIMISKFKKLLNDNYNSRDNTNKKLIESYADKAINQYRSFDDRMEILLNKTKLIENNINETSKYHEKLINRINHVNKYYD
jgi:hypothetical protein